MNTQTKPAAHTATTAAHRNQDRIKRIKADLQAAIVAEQHARRRRDFESAHAWIEAIAGLRAKLDSLTSCSI